MKVFVTVVVLFGMICNLNVNEACSWTKRPRGRNPKIIRILPTTTEAVEQPTTIAPTEQATEAVITTKPPVATEGGVELTNEAAGGEVNKVTEVATEKPVVATTEAAAQDTTKPPTEAAIPTEPKAVEANTELVDPLTRPTSAFKFFKQSAFVSSTKDERTCPDVNGQCKEQCDTQTEYLRGRFQCPFPTNCCVKK